MNMIGGADGPTSIYLAGSPMGWINVYGGIILIAILIPNIIYAMKFRNAKNKCTNHFFNIMEQVGRYGTMFLMVFNIGVAEFEFNSLHSFLIYFFGNIVLVISYWILWGLYFKSQKLWKSLALAIVPTAIFLLSGIALMHVLLIVSAIIFGVSHIYITYVNAK